MGTAKVVVMVFKNHLLLVEGFQGIFGIFVEDHRDIFRLHRKVYEAAPLVTCKGLKGGHEVPKEK